MKQKQRLVLCAPTYSCDSVIPTTYPALPTPTGLWKSLLRKPVHAFMLSSNETLTESLLGASHHLGSVLRACAPYERAEASHMRSLTAAGIMTLASLIMPSSSPGNDLCGGDLWVASLFPSRVDSVSPAKSLGTLLATPYQHAPDLKLLLSLAYPSSSPPEPWPLLSQVAMPGSGKCLDVSGAFWPLSFILFFLICVYYFNYV